MQQTQNKPLEGVTEVFRMLGGKHDWCHVKAGESSMICKLEC